MAATHDSARRRRHGRTFAPSQAVILGGVHALGVVALAMPSLHGAYVLVAAYLFTGFGITLGYHRLVAHRAFRTSPVVRSVLCTAAAFAFQGGPITWVGFHRAHHAFTDEVGDPHSAARGFYWSHVGWALHRGPNGYRRQRLRRLTADLERDSFLCWLERWSLTMNLGLFAIVWISCGAAIALWAFPLRILLLWHVTWCANSIGHGAGSEQPRPRNVTWLACIGFGEGYHENHHRRPSSPRFSDGPYSADFGYWLLLALARLRLVRLRVS